MSHKGHHRAFKSPGTPACLGMKVEALMSVNITRTPVCRSKHWVPVPTEFDDEARTKAVDESVARAKAKYTR